MDRAAFNQKVEEACDICPNDIKVLLRELNVKIGTEEICRGLIGRHSHSLHVNTNIN